MRAQVGLRKKNLIALLDVPGRERKTLVGKTLLKRKKKKRTDERVGGKVDLVHLIRAKDSHGEKREQTGGVGSGERGARSQARRCGNTRKEKKVKEDAKKREVGEKGRDVLPREGLQ